MGRATLFTPRGRNTVLLSSSMRLFFCRYLFLDDLFGLELWRERVIPKFYLLYVLPPTVNPFPLQIISAKFSGAPANVIYAPCEMLYAIWYGSKCIHKYSVQYLKLFFCKLDIVCGSNVAAKNIQIIGFCL